jgi:hypothetical protein
MPSSFCYAGIITVTLTIGGPARAQPIAPPGSGVTIKKIVVDNGPARSVKFYVTGGSPRLEALVRRVEWAENELSIVEQLQLLKLETVVNERRVAGFRTAQLTSPLSALSFLPYSSATYYGGYGGDGQSSLQRVLTGQLALEATPEAALQLIGFLEEKQTELDAQLKALPPQEKKAAQGFIDDLRPRLAALPHGDVSRPRPQPVVLPQIRSPAPAIRHQPPVPPVTAAPPQKVRQDPEAVRQQIMQAIRQTIQQR